MMEPIILASSSPRRQEYFRLLGLPFTVMPPDVDEDFDPDLSPTEVTATLARRKIGAILDHLPAPPPWICAADTVVGLDGEVLGKSPDRDGARAMLHRLRGRTHQVFTSVALYRGRDASIDCRTARAEVDFAPASDAEIEWYLDTEEWRDAAGSYRVQGLGGCFAESIRGSYSAIVGLPLREFYLMLQAGRAWRARLAGTPAP